MKKIFSLLTIALFSIALTACGGGAAENVAPSPGEKKAAPEKRMLVAYFSRADENYNVGYIEKGNTRILAEMIAEATGADMFEIKPVNPYPKEYTPATEAAKAEKLENARPKISGTMPDVSDYEVIFLGYPIWWGDLPMACYTFFERVNLSGKTVVPFCTHEGSGLSGTDRYIAEATKANVKEALAMTGRTAQQSRDEAKTDVMNWLKKLGYVK